MLRVALSRSLLRRSSTMTSTQTMSPAYNHAAMVQLAVFDSSKAILLKALHRLSNVVREKPHQAPITISDLGVAGGQNCIAAIDFVVMHLHQEHKDQQREFQVVYNDLPAQDWRPFLEALTASDLYKDAPPRDSHGHSHGPQVHHYLSPKSFYSPLFPPGSVDLFVSMIALHWLSAMPTPLPGFAMAHFYPSSIPPSVLELWSSAAHNDLVTFLQRRARELRIGGQMVLSMVALPEEGFDSLHAAHSMPALLDLERLYERGLLSMEEIERMSFCYYFRTKDEVVRAVSQVPDLRLEDSQQRTESYTFPTALDLAAFLIATHENSILGCLHDDREGRREPILQALRDDMLSKLGPQPVLKIDYCVVALSRRGSEGGDTEGGWEGGSA